MNKTEIGILTINFNSKGALDTLGFEFLPNDKFGSKERADVTKKLSQTKSDDAVVDIEEIAFKQIKNYIKPKNLKARTVQHVFYANGCIATLKLEFYLP